MSTRARDNKASHCYTNRNVWESQRDKFGYDTEDGEEADEDFYIIGDRVYVDGYKLASVAYFGEVGFATGDWVGVVLDEPTGSHSGKVHGREYFQCAPLHGLFVRTHRVSRAPDSALGSSTNSSRVQTPAPTNTTANYSPSIRSDIKSRSSSVKSPGASTLDSYFYDEDYRPSNQPTVESLARKLRSIGTGTQSSVPRKASRSLTRSDSLDISPRQTNSPSRATPICGILKTRGHDPSETTRVTRPHSSLSARIESDFGSGDINRQSLRYNSDRFPVFNFRPKRERLRVTEDYSQPPQQVASERKKTLKTMHSSYGSQPNLASGRISVDLSTEPPKSGDRVIIRTERGDMTGVLRFMGETEFATGEWAGVELDEPDGKNDGSVLGVRYFYSPKGYGLFVPATRVRKAKAESPEFKAVRSTIKSPPPLKSRASFSSSYNSTPSTTPNYLDEPITPYESKELSYSPASASLSSRATFGSRYYPDAKFTTSTLGTNSNLTNYGSSSQLYNPKPSDTRRQWNLDSSPSWSRPKFDDADIEFQLRKTLRQSAYGSGMCLSPISKYTASERMVPPTRPKSIKYTFSSSKYDGNPVARRTVQYA